MRDKRLIEPAVLDGVFRIVRIWHGAAPTNPARSDTITVPGWGLPRAPVLSLYEAAGSPCFHTLR